MTYRVRSREAREVDQSERRLEVMPEDRSNTKTPRHKEKKQGFGEQRPWAKVTEQPLRIERLGTKRQAAAFPALA